MEYALAIAGILIFYLLIWCLTISDKKIELERNLVKERRNFEERLTRDRQKAEFDKQNEIQKMKIELSGQAYKNRIERNIIEIAKEPLIKASEMFAEYYSKKAASTFDGAIRFLENKRFPARKTANEIKSIIKREIKEKLKSYKQYEYIIKTYESMFPWLEDFKQIPLENTFKSNLSENTDDDEVISKYLHDNEKQTLSKTEKFQRALDRYTDSWDKNNWQIGLFYERYNGYLKEMAGYKVLMNGAQKRWQDMGIDIIATKKDCVELIQCKYWAKDKTIYEKYIFQLFGTSINYIVSELKKDNPFELIQRGIVKPIFVTSTQLSNTARRVAQALHVELLENQPLRKDYPKIKCNPSSEFGRIYHLPFDQQYDNFQVSQTQGACYVATIQEAEEKGFRRAYRWHKN